MYDAEGETFTLSEDQVRDLVSPDSERRKHATSELPECLSKDELKRLSQYVFETEPFFDPMVPYSYSNHKVNSALSRVAITAIWERGDLVTAKNVAEMQLNTLNILGWLRTTMQIRKGRKKIIQSIIDESEFSTYNY